MPESPKIKHRSFLMQTESKSVFLILCALVFLTFLLCDVFKIGNESGEWIFFNPENISNILNPNTVVVGGGVSAAGEFLRSHIESYFKLYAFPQVKQSTKIKIAELGNDAGIIGAASLAHQFLES